MRRATFANGWVRDLQDAWQPLLAARFTASGATWEAKDSIDAGVANGQFYLQTGSDTKTTTPLGTRIERPADTAPPPALPQD